MDTVPSGQKNPFSVLSEDTNKKVMTHRWPNLQRRMKQLIFINNFFIPEYRKNTKWSWIGRITGCDLDLKITWLHDRRSFNSGQYTGSHIYQRFI